MDHSLIFVNLFSFIAQEMRDYMANLLLDERPLLVMPKLASLIGLPESIFLQQLHYWTEHSSNIIDGNKWVYNSVKEWRKQFPFWSERTLRRIIKGLEDEKLIIVGNFNKLAIDQTKWYRINYENLYLLDTKTPNLPNGKAHGQIDHMERPKVAHGLDKLDTPLPEITTKITSENKRLKDNVADAPSSLNQEIVNYLNNKANTNFRSTSKKTQQLIRARLNEEFSLQDFKTVIDKKTGQWLNDIKMNQYLRPETLFGTKFESYLNEKGATSNAIDRGSDQQAPKTYSDGLDF